MIKTVLTAALILTTTTGAFAAAKHPRHAANGQQPVSAQKMNSAYGANASANTNRSGAVRGGTVRGGHNATDNNVDTSVDSGPSRY
jgi:hypothetical protein